MTSILIVDDHDLVRAGLAGIIKGQPELRVVAEAGSGEEALKLARDLEPDIVLMDVELPGLSGLETTERLLRSQPKIGVVVLTAHSEPPLPSRLLEVGARGYLSKSCRAEELLQAIRSVARGERYLAPDIAQQLALSLLPGSPSTPFSELTPREMEITMMLVQGMKASTIGEVVNLAPKTVASHKYRIYAKTGAGSEVELLKLALRYGLAKGDPAGDAS